MKPTKTPNSRHFEVTPNMIRCVNKGIDKEAMRRSLYRQGFYRKQVDKFINEYYK